MFDFIFKRRNDTSSTVASAPASSPAQSAAAKTAPAAAQSKQAAMLQAEALDGSEAAAVEFILQCEFADARAIAARHVVSLPMLERVLLPMRKTDRRVARLLQQRLEALAHQQRVEQLVQAWLASAQCLLQEPQLLPNQVAELDRSWQAIGPVQPMQDAQYQPVRAGLGARLLAQAALQRAALDTLAHLRQLQQTVEGASPLPPVDEVARALGILEGAMEHHFSAPEAISLPRHVRADFERQRATLRESWQVAQQREAALLARQQLIAGWEEVAPESLDGAELQRVWQGLPAVEASEGASLLAARWQNLLQKIDEVAAWRHPRIRSDAQLPPHTRQRAQQQAQQQTPQQARQKIDAALTAMEAALDEGALQHALDCDSTLRGFDALINLLSAADAVRLHGARAELSRLQGWARWGGNISRTELLKAAQELPDQQLAVAELAKQVGALRARWKALDVSAGAAPKALWQQFDTACTAAYVPAAEHFSKLIEQRRQNLVAAQALIEQVRAFTAGWPEIDSESDAGSMGKAAEAVLDWKAAALFCTRSKQAWQRLGNLEHKERKPLQRDFDDALQKLQRPLARQQASEAQQREQLIAAVLALNPTERGAPDALRDLQQRWQLRAKSLPLEHQQEEALWQRFRTVCDQLFTARKQASADADAERRANLQAKQVLCQDLEAALKRGSDSDGGQASGPASPDLPQLIAGMAAAWSRIGAVPRAQEAQLEQRRAAALAAAQEKLQAANRQLRQAGADALHSKLALCQALERQLAATASPLAAATAEAQTRWLALPALAVEFERTLGRRFAAIQAACQGFDRAYAEQLENNRAQLLNDILRLEISSGLPSPAELASQRLHLQVEVLAAKLKSGDPARAGQQQWLALCGLPALTDAAVALRIEHLLHRYTDMPAGTR